MTTNSQNGSTTAAAVQAAQARLAAANQAAQAPQPQTGTVLRTGESISTTEAGLYGKTYYHRVPGAKTHLPDGLEIQFLGGIFATSDQYIISELDKVANNPASGIFTSSEIAENLLSKERAIAADAANTVGDNAKV